MVGLTGLISQMTEKGNKTQTTKDNWMCDKFYELNQGDFFMF